MQLNTFCPLYANNDGQSWSRSGKLWDGGGKLGCRTVSRIVYVRIFSCPCGHVISKVSVGTRKSPDGYAAGPDESPVHGPPQVN